MSKQSITINEKIKIIPLNDEALYIEMKGRTYYIDDSTNEKICAVVPSNLTEMQKERIHFFLEKMNSLQEEAEENGTIKPNQIQWCNELYDHVMISLGNDPDGDYQNQLADDNDYMTYQEMFDAIETRIENTF